MVEVQTITKAQMLDLWLNDKLSSIVVIGTDVYARTVAQIHGEYRAIVKAVVT